MLDDVDVSIVLVSLDVEVLPSLFWNRDVEADELLSEDVSAVRERVRLPIVVGVDSDVADAVRSTETLAIVSSSSPDGAVTTVLANDDVEPHPYWKKPPSN